MCPPNAKILCDARSLCPRTKRGVSKTYPGERRRVGSAARALENPREEEKRSGPFFAPHPRREWARYGNVTVYPLLRLNGSGVQNALWLRNSTW